MELKDKLISSFMAFEERVDVLSAVHDIRTKALKNFEHKGFPTKKEESWKYTSLNAILKISPFFQKQRTQFNTVM
jgi:Fe-S cluster assembly protein SufD